MPGAVNVKTPVGCGVPDGSNVYSKFPEPPVTFIVTTSPAFAHVIAVVRVADVAVMVADGGMLICVLAVHPFMSFA